MDLTDLLAVCLLKENAKKQPLKEGAAAAIPEWKQALRRKQEQVKQRAVIHDWQRPALLEQEKKMKELEVKLTRRTY